MGLIRLLPRPGGSPPAPSPEREPEHLERVERVPEPVVSEAAPDPSPDVSEAPAPDEGEAPVAADPTRAATRVIALANQKGGVAKTTTTLNLGVAFREMGYRVLLVDLDPQGNLTMSQGLNPDAIERSMFDVLVHRVPISEVI